MKKKKPATNSQRKAAATAILSIQQLAAALDVSSMTIRNWVTAGMPQEARGRYDLVACMRWWRETINDNKDDDSITAVRARYWTAKAQDAEIDVATKRGELIANADVIEQWSRRVSEVRQGLLSLETRLPPIVEGKTLREIRAAIKIEVGALLDGYARAGKFCQVRR
jgi:phage terminase Nu1 subunit (DNA packaging protein)